MGREITIIKSWIESLQAELDCLTNRKTVPEKYDFTPREAENILWELTDSNEISKTENQIRVLDVFLRFVERNDKDETMDKMY